MRATRLWWMSFGLAAAMSFEVACSGDSTSGASGQPNAPFGGGTPDAGVYENPDTGAFVKPDGGPPPEADAGAPRDTAPTPDASNATEWLEFSTPETGDDGHKCTGEPQCTVEINFNSDRTVAVRYMRQEEGAQPTPVQGGLVRFTWLEQDAGSHLSLSANAVYTDDQGIAQTKIEVTDNTEATYHLVAQAENDAVQPIQFVVRITSKLGPPLIIEFEPHYDKAKVKFKKVDILLYKHAGDQQFPCGNMELVGKLPSATIQLPSVLSNKVDDPVQVTDLPDLDKDKQQAWTIVALGVTDKGAVRVAGCNDADAQVSVGVSTTAVVPLDEMPPDYTGVYDVTTFLDLTSALPDNVKAVTDIIFALFQSPAGGLALLACYVGDKADVGVLQDLCGFVFANPQDPQIGEWDSATANAIIDAVDALIQGLIAKNQTASQIFYTGKDIADILTGLELHGVIEMKPLPGKTKCVPDDAGMFTEEQCSQTWDEIAFQWTLNAGCPPADPSCGQYTLNFDQFSNTPLATSHFAARVDPTFFDMNVFAHGVNFKYGALLNAIIKEFLLPAVFGDGSDGYPKIDNYEDAIKTFMCGKEGLLPENDCCQMFADGVTNNGGGFLADTVKAACKSLPSLAAGFIEGQLTGLDLDTENLLVSTPADQPCKLYDDDSDGRIDSWGRKTEMCKWQLHLEILGLSADFDADFYAIRE